jgi:hypothetical protein
MTNSPQDIVDRNYSLNIGNYFGRGWDLFKQYALPFIGFLVLVIAFGVVASKLPFPLGNNENGQGGIVSSILSPIFMAGFYIVAFKLAKGRSVTFSDFFRGFNNFLQIFLTNWVGSLLIVIGLILLVIPGIYLMVAYFFAIPLVIEKRLDFWTALETSRKVVTKQWFSFLGFGLLLFLVNLAGACLLGLGLLVTVPWTFCMITAAYEDVVGLNMSSEDV